MFLPLSVVCLLAEITQKVVDEFRLVFFPEGWECEKQNRRLHFGVDPDHDAIPEFLRDFFLLRDGGGGIIHCVDGCLRSPIASLSGV